MSDRIVIAGTHSGCGKTTVTCALLWAIKKRGLNISAFKCGPDYIDPMFHREVIGVPSHNLDPFFSTDAQLCAQLCTHHADISVIEGVMGYYDGIGTGGQASTYDAARATKTPVLLVVNCRGMYTSAGALIEGFRGFRENSNLRGVIFNNTSPMLYEGLKVIAQDAGVLPLGFLPHTEEVSIGSRHLGLITAGELADVQNRLSRLGALAEGTIDIDGVLRVAKSAPALAQRFPAVSPLGNVRIAVAHDAAFCFIYRENLELLESLGCEIVCFSPISDNALPPNIGGLYLPGGYPELYAQSLFDNTAMRSEVKAAITGGLPTIAECGGFMYLHETIDGFPMAGVIAAKAYKTDKLRRFGYITLTANRDNLLSPVGGNIRAHEFHYYESTSCGDAFTAHKAGRDISYPYIHANDTLYAGFPHLYFPANQSFAESFVRKAARYA